MRSLTRILASLSIYSGDKIQRNSKLRNVRENLRNFYVHYKLLLHIISLLDTLVINHYFALAAAELSIRHINAKYNFKILMLKNLLAGILINIIPSTLRGVSRASDVARPV